jgi:hypothetical protein
MQNFNKICERVYELREKFHLGLYVNKALLWMSMTENSNCPNISVKAPSPHVEFYENLPKSSP